MEKQKSNIEKIQISVQCYPNKELIKEVREYSKLRSIQAKKQNISINVSGQNKNILNQLKRKH